MTISTFVTVLYWPGKGYPTHRLVSIQLLLLFYWSTHHGRRRAGKFQYNFCYCSIYKPTTNMTALKRFQYNFCYCSIATIKGTTYNLARFNTTFVTVLCTVTSYPIIDLVFQYNFCYCSRKKCVIFRLNRFNTTFVTVLSCIWIKNCAFKNSFNTTFVTVLFYPH